MSAHSATQSSLDSAVRGTKPTYPHRPRFFAMKFLRLLAKTCAAQDIGQDAFCLLTVIVTLEDSTHYRRGITFYNEQLLPILGFTRWHRLDAARKSAVEAGWLHYQPSPIGRRQAGVYWVLIPEHAETVPDGSCDEGEQSTEQSTETVECKPVHSTESVERQSTETVERCVERCVELSDLSLSRTNNPNNKKRSARVSGISAEQIRLPQSLEVPEVRQALSDWLTYKRSKGQGYKQAAHLERKLGEFESLGPAEFVAAVNASIGNNYDGLFPAKGNANGKPHGRPAVDRSGARYDPTKRVGDGF